MRFMSRTKIVTLTTFLRTCEKITRCRVAAGFLAWPRREGGGNTRSGVADALHRPAGCLRRLSPFARLSRPSNAGQAKKTRNPGGESKKGRLAALPARLQPAAGMRPRVRLAIRPFLLSCGAL